MIGKALLARYFAKWLHQSHRCCAIGDLRRVTWHAAMRGAPCFRGFFYFAVVEIRWFRAFCPGIPYRFLLDDTGEERGRDLIFAGCGKYFGFVRDEQELRGIRAVGMLRGVNFGDHFSNERWNWIQQWNPIQRCSISLRITRNAHEEREDEDGKEAFHFSERRRME